MSEEKKETRWEITREQLVKVLEDEQVNRLITERDSLRAKVERLRERVGHLHDASMDAFNFIGGANPPISKEDLIETLKEEMSKARKELNE